MVLAKVPVTSDATELGAEQENDACMADTESDGEDVPAQTNNDAWADAMGKILRKRGPDDSSKSIILAKSKEKDDENKQERVEKRERARLSNKKRKWEEMNHVKPDPLEKDYERSLQKIATRGVVQLFNAVKKHQTQLDKKMKTAKTEGKKERVMKSISKGDFMDMLKPDSKKTKNVTAGEGLDNADREEKQWDVLRDDYMMGSKLKDWDKQPDEV